MLPKQYGVLVIFIYYQSAYSRNGNVEK